MVIHLNERWTEMAILWLMMAWPSLAGKFGGNEIWQIKIWDMDFNWMAMENLYIVQEP